MQKQVKMDDELKYIIDTVKGTTRMVIKGEQSEDGYLINDEFAVYVDTDWINKTIHADEVVRQFKMRLEEVIGQSAKVFHISNGVK
ncbi:hypothetical protein MHI39_23790 [Heyndrickxia sp. FSL K6-6286]|uniref:hypothetical protein n=1 Tax=Heyndrickxia sp. FSL K6-6286 TaxID=2921510 RepID=UPI00315A7406